MSEMNPERLRILVKICQLYYEDGLNQLEIAKRLGISRPHVSRMLTAAKTEGIVRIAIHNPFSGEQELEKQFVSAFGIQDAIIVDVDDGDPLKLQSQLGRTSAALIESVLMDGDIVGVMAGRTVASAAGELDYFPREGLRFVPLIGGWGSEGASWHAGSNAMAFANKLKSKYWLMHAPATVSSIETGQLLRQEPEIDKVLQLARRSRVAVISIGEVDEGATMAKSGSVNRADIAMLEERGAVANLCASFIDRDGRELDFPEQHRWIGLSASELRAIPTVIGIAGGERKAEAITAALRGKWIDVLVTDAATAKAVMALHLGE
ncbi:sugar-binding transcriptional regulator [Paenibacillus rhizovicinus]|uniref:Sugar-binding transcriptional regulator n=1 Tax=Paenibacillus rhizovicinus TaxID=2704463 RepID=A0A6C0NW77_9BACL|nr:sugar-binding transcriptional regulator [Paenibacillus rhizovicinus]QHW29973.1 sugar-binding transcriptional regulator [Paenibacillus rhizovicinus]